MKPFEQIKRDAEVTRSKPCITGDLATMSTVAGFASEGYTGEDILEAYPYLQGSDISKALAYAPWRVEESDVP